MSTLSQRGPGRPVDEALRAQRRQDILEAAVYVFAKHGYQDADVQFIADRLGVGKGTVYRYFPSKEKLFLAAVDHGLRRVRSIVLDSITDVGDGLAKLEHAIVAYLRVFDANPAMVELLLQERAVFRDRRKPTYFALREADPGPWPALLRELIAAERVRRMPVERIIDVLGDLVYGTMFTNFFAGRRKPLEEQARDVMDIAFHGILSDRERKRRAENGSRRSKP